MMPGTGVHSLCLQEFSSLMLSTGSLLRALMNLASGGRSLRRGFSFLPSRSDFRLKVLPALHPHLSYISTVSAPGLVPYRS